MYNCYNNLMADSAYYWNKKIADKFLYDCDNIVKLAEYYNQNEMYDSTLLFKPNPYTTIFMIAQIYGLIKDTVNEKVLYDVFGKRCKYRKTR